jgi:threonyl-tRNA synthetase
LPIADRHIEYAAKVKNQLMALNPALRIEIDDRAESVGKKIRDAATEKVPYQAVIGDKEMEASAVAVRGRNDLDLGAISVEDFAKRLAEEIQNKQ